MNQIGILGCLKSKTPLEYPRSDLVMIIGFVVANIKQHYGLVEVQPCRSA